MLVSLFGIASVITSAIGTVAFFTHSYTLLIVCAVISIADSLIQIIWGEQNNLNTEIATIVIFSVVSFFSNVKWIILVSFGLCISSLLITIVGWVLILFFIKR